MDLQKQKETPKQKVMTLNAEQMFRYCEKNASDVFMLDLTDYSLQKNVVEQTEDREDCPLFHQIYRAIEEMEELESGTLEITDKTIYDKLIIIDFDKVFRDDIYANNDLTQLKRKEKLDNAQYLVENGLDILFEDGKDKIHFEAFDKSGSMSRTSRISFVADELREELDKRLNLGMDFTQIDYVDSKYYAYRGLRRFTETDKETYENNVHVTNVSYEKYMEFYKLYEKYFGKLTGIVMVPRGSAVPLILGGADFDGDLVKVIYNQEVVKAVAKGRTYEEESGENKKGIKYKYYKRRLPVIKIPDYKDQNDNVNEKEQNNKDTSDKKDVRVPWSHIINTFSNKIGLISDTAISIGQKEYGRGNESEIEFASKEPSCAKCTLLTGLEIDAAKNGKHPNLDTILKKDIEKSSYISFLHNFKKLRGQSNYSIDRLKVKKEEPNIKYIEFYVTAEGTKARFKLTDDGTYINELPKVFKESLEEYKKAFTDNTPQNAKKVTYSFFEYPKNLSEKEKKAIEEYKKACRSVLDYYRFYANIFLPRLRNEKEKNFYAPENIERNLFQIYDEETAMAIRQKVVPSICRKIKESVSNQNSIETMIERLEEEQWVLLPQKERDKALTRIIRNERI